VTGKLIRASLITLALAPAIAALLLTIDPDLAGKPAARRAAPFAPPSWIQPAKPNDSYLLGTDYLGRPFVPVLCSATAATVRIALLGTALVLLGCLAVGVVHGSIRSRGLEGIIAAGNLGVMAVPEAAVLITLATAWPRLAPALWVNASMIAVLVAFAIPTGARLIADRVRAVGRSGFVAASRAYGASPVHTFRCEVWPHLAEDVAWVVASVLPRFVAIEVGLAYLGVEYRDFEGLGKLLAKSFSNLGVETAVIQMLAVIAVVLWVAVLPQIVLRMLGIRVLREAPA
jgi:ABC-type dipeptide/oligopeptide/nickel transport system permease subunit